MAEVSLKTNFNKNISLKEFHNRKNNVLIHRVCGGLGDILMHRMLFEDMKKLDPEINITFSCLEKYFDAVKDHPYIDNIINCKISDEEIYKQYGMHYNTSAVCDRFERGQAPYVDTHRSDIWALRCGLELKNHEMHINLSDEEVQFGKNWIKERNNSNQKTVGLFTVSAMPSKNLNEIQIKTIIKYLKENNYFICSSHYETIEHMEEIPTLINPDTREWMSLINALDYVISVDTAAFHCAGGMKKKVMGIFSWADGYVYGKYYPNAIITQLHRNTHPEWTCGPCYRWNECPFVEKGNNNKPCLTKISGDMLADSMKKLLTI